MPPTPRSEPIELQNLHKNSAAGRSQKNSKRELTDIMVWLAFVNATDDGVCAHVKE